MINGPSYETKEILENVCGGNPEQLNECIEIEHAEERIAETTKEKEITQKAKEKSEKEKAIIQEHDTNIWDIMM